MYRVDDTILHIDTSTLEVIPTAKKVKRKMLCNIYNRGNNYNYIVFQVFGKHDILRFKVNFKSFSAFLNANGIKIQKFDLKNQQQPSHPLLKTADNFGLSIDWNAPAVVVQMPPQTFLSGKSLQNGGNGEDEASLSQQK